MASYSIFPRQDLPPSRHDRQQPPHSRFVEGSMNDRVSNAPPMDFLGPEEAAAYERQFYLDSQSSTRPSRPVSTSTSETSGKRGSGSFFAPLWDGVRERLQFSRTKSSGSVHTVASGKGKVSGMTGTTQAGGAGSGENAGAGSAAGVGGSIGGGAAAGTGYYPSREEVMENYKQLVEAGFFSSHAIQGTRHQPTPPPARASTHPLPVPPPPSRDPPAVPFSHLVAQRQQQHQVQHQTNPAVKPLSSLFSSIPYSATQPSPTGDAPLGAYPRPDPRPMLKPRGYYPPTASRPATASRAAAAAAQQSVSPQRGTKRAMADMSDTSSANGGVNTGAETGARKLVKKLRKSASRVTVVDTSSSSSSSSGRPVTSHGSGHMEGGGIFSRSGENKSSVDLVPRPPVSFPGGARAMGIVRSLSGSFRRDGASGKVVPATTAPSTAMSSEGSASMQTPTMAPAPNRLIKARRSLGRRVSLSRPGSRSTSSSFSSSAPPPPPAHLPPPVPPHRQPAIIPYSDPEPVPQNRHHHHPLPSPAKSARQGDDSEDRGDPMVLDYSDAEPPSTRNPSLDVPTAGGLSVPSFHYPQRQKLAVVPDPNRGIPEVPGIPVRFAGMDGKKGHGKSGSFCFGTGGAGAAMGSGTEGERQKENVEVF